MQYPQLPIFAFLSAILVLVPLPWHWRARNVATIAIVAWLFVVNLIYGINSIVWAGNVIDHAPVWCDITTKIIVGASYALPLATLCICKHLEMVASSRKVQYDISDRHRRMIFEGIMCFAVPALFMALHYIVQGHRYDIFENTGCQAALYISIPAVMLVWFPQLLFAVITLIYAVIALHHFVRRRLTFASHLQNSNSALTTNRYLRLIAMAVTEMVWGTAFTTFNLYNNVSPGLRPWTTWADVHSNFSRVDLFPAAEIPPEFLSRMMVFWWTMPASSLIFFLFFGFGEEAKKEYRKHWQWFKTRVLRMSPGQSSKSGKLVPGGRRPFKLGALVSTNRNQPHSEKKQQFLSPNTSSSSHLSSFTLMPPTPTKSEEATTEADTMSISTMSHYAYTTNSAHLPGPILTHAQQESISNGTPAPRGHSPSPSVPVSVRSYEGFRETLPSPTTLPSPIYYPPFGPSSVCPITPTHTRPEHGILVTIHRQASADQMV